MTAEAQAEREAMARHYRNERKAAVYRALQQGAHCPTQPTQEEANGG